jgi:hypothetical protein
MADLLVTRGVPDPRAAALLVLADVEHVGLSCVLSDARGLVLLYWPFNPLALDEARGQMSGTPVNGRLTGGGTHNLDLSMRATPAHAASTNSVVFAAAPTTSDTVGWAAKG